MRKTNFLKASTIHLVLFAILAFNVFARDNEEKARLAQVIIEKSGITPLIVLETVQKKYPQGIIYEYEMEQEDDNLVHEVELIHLEEKRRYQITIDAQTGEITEEESDTLFWFGKDDDVKAAEYLSQSGFHLSEAIQKIALEKGEVIQKVEFEEKQGIRYVEIQTHGPEGKRKWLIDAERQTIIPHFKK